MPPKPAVAHYVTDHRAFTANGGAGPAWLSVIRNRAIARFVELGIPTQRQEEWRFTNVQHLADKAFSHLAPHALSSGEKSSALDQLLSAGLPHAGTATRLVFLNGRFAEALSSKTDLPKGVRVESLARAITDGPLVEQHLGRYASIDRNPFTALNTAFIADGALVYVPRGTVVEAPIHLLFLTYGPSDEVVSHPRVLVILDREAEATIVETHAAFAAGTYLSNAVTELVLGDATRCRYYRIQDEGPKSYHLAATQSHQGRDSNLTAAVFALGSALSRHDIGAVMGGTGGSLTLDGLSVLSGRQHVDHHTVLDHAQPHCESHERFNGVYAGQSRGVFTGRIIVRPGAQRTDSKQTSNSLILSEEARADSQPQLEIYADDVKCTHGATLGPLDQNAMFYLRTRGLDPNQARQILTYGFGAEILQRVEVPEIRQMLERMVKERLAATHEAVAP